MKTANESRLAPAGSSVVCPYLMVESVEAQMKFLVQVFGAIITEDAKRKDGFIQHGEVLIADTVIMMGRSSADWPARQSMNYVYVADADYVFEQALSQGAVAIMPPANRFYGIREGGFADPNGNQWWVAQVIESLSKEELARRTAEQ